MFERRKDDATRATVEAIFTWWTRFFEELEGEVNTTPGYIAARKIANAIRNAAALSGAVVGIRGEEIKEQQAMAERAWENMMYAVNGRLSGIELACDVTIRGLQYCPIKWRPYVD